MLILTRRQGESVIVNDKTRLTFVRESKGVAKFEIERDGRTQTVIIPLNETSAIGIGGHLEVSKRYLQSRQIRLKFTIPDDVQVWREEIWQKINGKRFNG